MLRRTLSLGLILLVVALALSAAPVATAQEPASSEIVLPDGTVLPPLPPEAAVPSIHAEMLREHANGVFQFGPGAPPTVELPAENAPGASADGTWVASGSPEQQTYALPNSLQREIHGYLPYWMLDASALQYMRYDLVSTIAYFSVGARTDGSLEKSGGGWDGWNSSAMTNVINAAHSRGVKVILTVTMMSYDGGAGQATLLGNAAYRARLVQEIAAAVRSRNADGVNLDFEPVYTGEREEYTSFVRELKAGLVNAGVGSYLTVATMGGAATWATGYDVAGLTAPGGADHLFVMGYDYSWSGSARAGAVAPMHSSYMLDITESVDDYLRLTSPSKIIWGVPYYGRSWPTKSDELNAYTQPATSTSYSRAWYYTAGLEAAAAYGRRWDPNGLVPWFATWDAPNNTWREGYYDDAASLGYKYDLVNARGLAGTGMWTLLMDQGRSELWELIRNKFVDIGRPYVYATSPGNGSANVPARVTAWAWFSEPVTGVSGSSVRLHDVSTWNQIPAGVWYDAGSRAAWLTPSSPLVSGRTYRVELTDAIRDQSGIPLNWTGFTFTVAAGDTYNPQYGVRFLAGTHTGYQFDSRGGVWSSKSVSFGATTDALTSQRATIAGQGGHWIYVDTGPFAGYWVYEWPYSYVPGFVGYTNFSSPRGVTFSAGTHSGYTFDWYGNNLSWKTYTLSSATRATANARAVINGRTYLHVVDGLYAHHWVVESSAIRLD